MVRKSLPERPPHAELVSIRDAGARYHLHPDTIRRRIREGKLTGYKMGQRVLRVDLAELEALFQPISTTKGRVNSG